MRRESYTQVKNHTKQDRKRHEAYARQDKYDDLTIAEKFTTLIEGGSKKQRSKLEKLMDKYDAKKASVPTTIEPTKVPKAKKPAKAPKAPKKI